MKLIVFHLGYGHGNRHVSGMVVSPLSGFRAGTASASSFREVHHQISSFRIAQHSSSWSTAWEFQICSHVFPMSRCPSLPKTKMIILTTHDDSCNPFRDWNQPPAWECKDSSCYGMHLVSDHCSCHGSLLETLPAMSLSYSMSWMSWFAGVQYDLVLDVVNSTLW